MKSRFESIGLYLPEKEISTRELLSSLDRRIYQLFHMSGIENRRFRSENEDSYSLAVSAAQDCLKNSKYSASEIDCVIYTSITRSIGEYTYIFEPAMSLFIKNKLGMSSAINFDITNACAGMLTGAYILDNLIRAGIVKNGMIVSGECITPIAETALKEIKGIKDEQLASLTVGDAGAAFILDISDKMDEGIDSIEFITVAAFSDLCFGMASEKTVGIAMYTKAREIHNETFKRWIVLLEEFMDKHKDIPFDFHIPHQTSVIAIEEAERIAREYFKTEPKGALVYVDQYGNTASTSHFLVLYRAILEKRIIPGSRLLFHAGASGIVTGFLSATIGNLSIGDENCN